MDEEFIFLFMPIPHMLTTPFLTLNPLTTINTCPEVRLDYI